MQRIHRFFRGSGAVAGFSRSATHCVRATALVVLAFPAFGQIDQCNDRNPTGQFECTYRPQVIEPWEYQIPGPIKATKYYLDEQGAKDEYAANLVASCPTCCDPGTLINEAGWVDRSNTFAWLPSIPGWSDKTLTYSVTPRTSSSTCGTPWTFQATVTRHRTARCEGGQWYRVDVTDQSLCRRPRRNQECRVGHPISLPSLSKVFTETDYLSQIPGGLRFVRDYRSDGFSYPTSYTDDLWQTLGNTWTHNYAGYLLATPQSIWVSWGQAAAQHFYPPSGSNYPRALAPVRSGQQNKLVELAAGQYAYYTRSNEVVFYSNGHPVGAYSPSGWGVDLAYAGGRLSSVREVSARQLQFLYDSKGHLQSVVDPAGNPIVYQYKSAPKDSNGRDLPIIAFMTLSGVVFQDHQSRHYQVPDWVYDDSSTTPFATRVVGVIDEAGAQYETIKYDTNGQAISSELAGGVAKVTVSNGAASVTDPLGSQRNYIFDASAASLAGIYQPAGSGCVASGSNSTYDPNGNLASADDFNQHRTCYANDLSRNLEIARVEGLPTTATCSTYTASGATLPANTRKVSTQWHPDWRLETKIAEPGKLTTKVYNGQPDPFASGAIASCAPASAVLPDGKPIVVLCRQVEQATTDTDGHLGFSATLQAGVPARQQTWTYNQFGQVLTARGPRTDIDDTTTYAYYLDTTAEHTLGDLQSVTNAKGQVTQYPLYNKHGQVLRMMDANGVTTDHTYDLRQRLTSTSVAGATTRYDYWPTGLLKRVTQPDATYVDYRYDAAHRLIALSDNQGNRIDYTLDNAGNKIAEKVSDPGGALTRQLSRSIDALGRIQQTTGRE